MRPVKIQIRLRVRLIRIFTGRILDSQDAKFLYADNEDSEQTVRMRRLIWVGRTEGTFSHNAAHLIVISLPYRKNRSPSALPNPLYCVVL